MDMPDIIFEGGIVELLAVPAIINAAQVEYFADPMVTTGVCEVATETLKMSTCPAIPVGCSFVYPDVTAESVAVVVSP